MSALFVALFLFLPGAGQAAELYRAATYFETTGQSITVAWDAVTNATKYIWRVKSIEREKYIAIEGKTEHETTATRFTFSIPFMGHFVAEVKAVDDGGNESTWAKSDRDANATVEGENQGWWVYGTLAPVGDIVIKKGE
jgi:hypothetical protein